MAAGVVRQRIMGMRILVIRLLVDSYSGKLLAHVQPSLDPFGLRRCRTRPRGGRVRKSVLAVRLRIRDSTHRCVELQQQGVPPSVLQGLPRYGEPDAGGDGLALRSPGQTLEKRAAASRARQVEHAAARELVKGIRTVAKPEKLEINQSLRVDIRLAVGCAYRRGTSCMGP